MKFSKFIIIYLNFFIIHLINVLSHPLVDTYFQRRKELIRKSESYEIGANLTLDETEKEVNKILMKYKKQEFKEGCKDENFYAGQHFFRAKPYIKKSRVFRILQMLPKGASLHSHDTGLVSDKYIFTNITYRDNLYAKDDGKGPIGLKFFKKDPGGTWLPIAERRKIDPTFNVRLQKQMTLIVDNPEDVYPDEKIIWNAFQSMFINIEPLLTYKPVFRDYFYQALKELYEDNIRYLEFRGYLPQLYDINGATYDQETTVRVYYETARDFMKDHPDFWGVKFIFAPMRFTTNNIIEEHVEFIKKMNEKFPRFVTGFDLVGREDIGPPLKNFIASLIKMRSTTKLFFHAGETLWSGMPVDFNLFDAILLNTSRIGHGFAILKHPEVLRIVKEEGIALEIAPISNQVLGLVKDVRNHPANFLIAQNYPVVVVQDDPSFWGAKAVSYDWYYVFMGMSSRQSDLKLLKQLAINSIIYSSMEKELKDKAMEKWKQDWDIFLKQILEGNFLSS